MEGLFLRVLTLSLTCSAVILPLLLLGKTLRRRYAAKSLSLLWLLLAVRLLVPVELNLPAPVSVPLPRYTLTLPADQVPPEVPNPSGVEVTVATELDLSAMLPILWLMGGAGFLLYQGAAYLLARRALLRGSRKGARVQGVPVVYAPRAETAMTLGVLRPVLVLPQGDMEDLDLILGHELCHLRRRDTAYKALLLLCNAVHWFNPLVWLMTRAAGENLELCCDEEVLRGADETQRRRYGEVLLRAAKGRGPALATRFGSEKHSLKTRLANLFREKRLGVPLVCTIAAMVLVLGSLVAFRPAEGWDTLYVNETYDVSLRLPENWDGLWRAEERDREIDLYYKKAPQGMGLLATVYIAEAREKIPSPRSRLLMGGGDCWVYLNFPQGDGAFWADGADQERYNLMYQSLLELAGNAVQPADGSLPTPSPLEPPVGDPGGLKNDSAANFAAVLEAPMGVDFPRIDYVSSRFLVFHDYWGLAVFDFRQGQVVRLLDTPAIGMNLIQGDQYTQVKVSGGFEQIYLYNTPGESTAYCYLLEGDTVQEVPLAQVQGAAAAFDPVGTFVFPDGAKPLMKNLVYQTPDGTEWKVFETEEQWLWPLEEFYTITQTYGLRIHPITGAAGNHRGIDIQAEQGARVLAAKSGTVTQLGIDSDLGVYVEVDHGNGVVTRYATLESVAVIQGEMVEKDQTLGFVGTTGPSTGPHLHLEFLNDQDAAMDPMQFYRYLGDRFEYR